MPDVRDYIAERLAKKDAELRGLQDQASDNRGMLGVAQGVGQAIAGLSRAGIDSFNEKPYRALEAQADAPVADYMQRQKTAARAVQEAGAEQDYNRKAALQDPNSVQSTITRRLTQATMKKYGMDPTAVNGLSAADDFAQKAIENEAKRQATAAIRANAKGEKTDARHAKAMKDVQTMLESMRGNPAAQQAEKDLYASAKLNKLVGGKNLSPQMVQLAASEIAKIATGGVPTNEELKHLTPGSIPSTLAGLAQFVTNKPQSAEAQEFLKQYKNYANGISGDARHFIKDRYGRILETNKNALSPEDYQTLHTNYVGRFDDLNSPTGEGDERAVTNQPETKTVGGKTYVRVPGGWQEQD